MTIYGWLIFPLWLAAVVYWVISALRPKQGASDRWLWWREITLRLAFFALLVLAIELAALGHAVPSAEPLAITRSGWLGPAGLLLAAMGIALAIGARDWLTRPDRPELLTSGPYALVRHPLYGGLLLALLGSAMAQSSLWLLPLLLYGPAFIQSARREEHRLLEQFPERYRDYMHRTKMLLPFLL